MYKRCAIANKHLGKVSSGQGCTPPIDMEPDVRGPSLNHVPFKGTSERQVPRRLVGGVSLPSEAIESDRCFRNPRGQAASPVPAKQDGQKAIP